MSARVLGVARDALILTAGLEILVWPIAIWLVHADPGSARTAVAVTALALAVALLGLFMTWGDGGSRLLYRPCRRTRCW